MTYYASNHRVYHVAAVCLSGRRSGIPMREVSIEDIRGYGMRPCIVCFGR